MLNYCYYCDDDVNSKVKERLERLDINGVEIEYIAKVGICEECGEEIDIPELDRENISNANNEYRRKLGLITNEEINEILEKYDIGKKPLAKLLGWGENTIDRYLSGTIPLKLYSDELKRLKSTRYMKKLFDKNKNNLSNVASKKLDEAIKMQLKYSKKNPCKVMSVARFFQSKIDEDVGSSITPLKLQKLLYYAQGWHLAFFDVPLFEDRLEAWIHGPVNPLVYDEYKCYKSNNIGKCKFVETHEFDDEQIELLEEVYRVYGCYDALVLRKMTHNESPWKIAREGYEDDEYSNELIMEDSIKIYFSNLMMMFNISEITEIKRTLRVHDRILFN